MKKILFFLLLAQNAIAQTDSLTAKIDSVKTIFKDDVIIFNAKDTTTFPKIDSLKGVRKADIIVSKVIHNSYNVY